jgi:RHS repeat-associated protein
VTGQRLWDQTGTDAARRVTYRYNAVTAANGPGLLRAVVSPGGARDSVEYDARGNLAATISPQLTRVDEGNDALGRTVWVRTPIDNVTFRYDSTFYQLSSDQVDSTVSRGGAQRVVASNVYDAEGNLIEVSRRSSPDSAAIGTITTRWEYDLGGRQIVEVAPDGTPGDWTDNPRDSTFYDLAGNVVRVRTRRFAESLAVAPGTPLAAYVRMQYDAVNRLTHRITPAVHYPARNEGMALRSYDLQWELVHDQSDKIPPYPMYPNDGGSGYLIPADTAVFTYDGMGRMLSATNRDAVVRRGWYPGGALSGDTLSIRTWAEVAAGGNMTTSHVYGLEHSYDRNGRRTEIKHPVNIAPLVNGVVKDRTTYGYDPQTGALARVTDPLGTEYRYQYNYRGEVDALYLPGGITEVYRYDLDGRLALHQTHNQSTSPERYTPILLRSDTIRYDLRGSMLFSGNRTGAADSLTATYTPLGHLASSRVRSHGAAVNGAAPTSAATETPRYDALGNQIFRQTNTTFQVLGYASTRNTAEEFRYHPGTGRLRAKSAGSPASPFGYVWVHGDTIVYDAAGNVVWETTTSALLTAQDDFRDRAYFYGADGMLRASDIREVDDPTIDVGPFRRSFEEYRYDALGRRVLVRARKTCKQEPYSGVCSLGFVRRTVWDGDRELFEIQAPGGREPYYNRHMENDTAHINLDPITNEGMAIETNAFYGRVLYVHGLALDQPLGVVRLGYGDRVDARGGALPDYRAVGPYTISPHWNSRGQPVLGTYDNGAWRRCETIGGNLRCNWLSWPELYAAYARPRNRDNAWHGTLLQDKSDASGLSYRRNRYYDPAAGRFTQEDPIGLAGGLNVYGFANGDPVNYGDPFGLSATCNPPTLDCLMGWGRLRRELGEAVEGLADLRDRAVDRLRSNARQSLAGTARCLEDALCMATMFVGGSTRGAAGSGRLLRFQGPKPRYTVNPAHVPGQRGFNPRKTPLPADAQSVFQNAVPNDPVNPTAWFGRSADGQIYRFSVDRNGSAHFSGIDGVGDGVRNLTPYARQRLGQE